MTGTGRFDCKTPCRSAPGLRGRRRSRWQPETDTEARRRRRAAEMATMDEYLPKPYPGATPILTHGLPGLT